MLPINQCRLGTSQSTFPYTIEYLREKRELLTIHIYSLRHPSGECKGHITQRWLVQEIVLEIFICDLYRRFFRGYFI